MYDLPLSLSLPLSSLSVSLSLYLSPSLSLSIYLSLSLCLSLSLPLCLSLSLPPSLSPPLCLSGSRCLFRLCFNYCVNRPWDVEMKRMGRASPEEVFLCVCGLWRGLLHTSELKWVIFTLKTVELCLKSVLVLLRALFIKCSCGSCECDFVYLVI